MPWAAAAPVSPCSVPGRTRHHHRATVRRSVALRRPGAAAPKYPVPMVLQRPGAAAVAPLRRRQMARRRRMAERHPSAAAHRRMRPAVVARRPVWVPALPSPAAPPVASSPAHPLREPGSRAGLPWRYDPPLRSAPGLPQNWARRSLTARTAAPCGVRGIAGRGRSRALLSFAALARVAARLARFALWHAAPLLCGLLRPSPLRLSSGPRPRCRLGRHHSWRLGPRRSSRRELCAGHVALARPQRGPSCRRRRLSARARRRRPAGLAPSREWRASASAVARPRHTCSAPRIARQACRAPWPRQDYWRPSSRPMPAPAGRTALPRHTCRRPSAARSDDRGRRRSAIAPACVNPSCGWCFQPRRSSATAASAPGRRQYRA